MKWLIMKMVVWAYKKALSELPNEDVIEERDRCVKKYNKASALTRDNELLFLKYARKEVEKRGLA